MSTFVSIPAWFDWRLRVWRRDGSYWIRFNTSLVRLAPPHRPGLYRSTHRFQYQLGSIGAWPARATPATTTGVSIPAWFDWRHAVDDDGMQAERCFNTSLVRLAPLALRGGMTLTPRGFNTSLVRLAPQAAQLLRGRLYPFQYQLGSIGAGSPSLRSSSHAPVSIPAWFDWRRLRGGACGLSVARFNTSLVRLAPWQCLHPESALRLVSIPAWFDWRLRVRPTGDGRLMRFNTSLVRLAPPRRLGAILHVAQIRLGTFPPAARGYVTVDPR